MSHRTTPLSTLLPSEPTLEAASRQSSGTGPLASAAEMVAAAATLIEGSGPELTRETRDLLQSRLKMAVIVLFAGFAVFLVTSYFGVDLSEPIGAFLFGFHVVATLVLGLLAVALCRCRARSMWWLRASELTIFGLSAAFLVAMQFFITLASCERGMLDLPKGLWLVLIYTYALFIPNTIWRAAVAIGLMAAAPVALLLGMMWWYPCVAEHATLGQITRLVLIICLAGGGSVFGVDIIGSLRREAFEARQLGQYRLTQRIGAGGMGEVYLAEHQLLKRPCVVKVIRPDKAGDPKHLARFQREVRATAKLSHWNTVEIFDYGSTSDGTFYYVMEYLPGMGLGEIIERFGPMSPGRVIYLLKQACDALGEAHAAGLIHRDIKPANIFAAQRGGVYDVAKLLDFGLVKPLVDDEPIHLTAEGAITGSPLFMSPEQSLGDAKPDARSDIYSLGAVGYYLLTGRPPFEGDRAIKVMFAHAHEPVAPPSTLCSEIPRDLEQVILCCLAKSPADRYQTAAALHEALADCEAAGQWDRTMAAQWWQQKGLEAAVV